MSSIIYQQVYPYTSHLLSILPDMGNNLCETNGRFVNLKRAKDIFYRLSNRHMVFSVFLHFFFLLILFYWSIELQHSFHKFHKNLWNSLRHRFFIHRVFHMWCFIIYIFVDQYICDTELYSLYWPYCLILSCPPLWRYVSFYHGLL